MRSRGHIGLNIISMMTVIMCIAVLLNCASVTALAETVTNDNETLTVGVPADRCPVFYIDDDTGENIGIGIDLMRAAAENAGYAVSFKSIEEPTLKDALDNDAYDLVMPFGSAVKSAQGKDIIVSDNLMQTPFTLVTAGKRNLPPFNEACVGMLQSMTAGAETVKQLYPGMEIVFYDNMADAVKALQTQEVDALLHNSYVWSYVLQKPAYSNLRVQPSAMFSMDFRAGTTDTPEGRAIIERLDQGISALTDTQRQAITLDYTSRDLYEYDLSDYIREYSLQIVMLIILSLAFIIIVKQRLENAQREQERKMQQMLDYDPLTGVLSLGGFRKRAEELIRNHPDESYFLSYNNIRGFKFINESLGREAGDELLKFWASRSKENLTDEDAIGRVTSDQFVILRHIIDDNQMRLDEKNVFRPVMSFFTDQGYDNQVQISSGIYVLTPEDFKEIDIDHLIDLARETEKSVRESRTGNFGLYNPKQWERGRRVAEIISVFPSALESEALQVWLQPQVNYETGEISGAEALCRWNHSSLGWVSPGEFIKILEDAGLVYKLDSFVWDKVCQYLHRWNQQGSHRYVSVNVSRDDIRADRNLPEQFRNLISKYDLSPDQLRIEITETAFMDDSELLISYIVRLRELGFQVEMDDFGSGYSSLHMLKDVPVDRIKLDLHFLTDTGDREKGRTIISSMIQMMSALGMDIIAEGVETAEQAAFLHEKGCSEMQGYYFYKPMPVDEFESKVNNID